MDRYSYSGVAFSAAKGLDQSWCFSSEVGLPSPDLVFDSLLDTMSASSVCYKRCVCRCYFCKCLRVKLPSGYGNECYETEEMQQKVAAQFGSAQKQAGWKIVDASVTPKEVHAQITPWVLGAFEQGMHRAPVQHIKMPAHLRGLGQLASAGFQNTPLRGMPTGCGVCACDGLQEWKTGTSRRLVKKALTKLQPTHEAVVAWWKRSTARDRVVCIPRWFLEEAARECTDRLHLPAPIDALVVLHEDRTPHPTWATQVPIWYAQLTTLDGKCAAAKCFTASYSYSYS
eukprot:g43885.t1